MNWLILPKKVYFKRGSTPVALGELSAVYGSKKVMIVTDIKGFTDGSARTVDALIRKQGISTAEFFSISEEVTIADVKSGLPKMLEFEPDMIVAVGGANVMNAAKALWVLYETPEADLAELASKYNTAVADPAGFPAVGKKAKLITIVGGEGAGNESSPYAVVVDEATGEKKVICSWTLMPEITVNDCNFVMNRPAEVIKAEGEKTIAMAKAALEAEGTTDYIKGFAETAIEVVEANLDIAVNAEVPNPAAVEALCNAAVIAGFAFNNACEALDL